MGQIILVRGTGGSGKSTLVRSVMDRYQVRDPVRRPYRRRPIGYRCSRPAGRSLFVPGHYETPTGGCDTITSAVEAFDLVAAWALDGDVLFEGIIVQDDIRRCVELSRRWRFVAIALDVPLDVCLSSIQQRRDARGDARPLNPRNTTLRAKNVTRGMVRLREAGVETHSLSREAALAKCIELLQLPDDVVRRTDEGGEFELLPC